MSTPTTPTEVLELLDRLPVDRPYAPYPESPVDAEPHVVDPYPGMTPEDVDPVGILFENQRLLGEELERQRARPRPKVARIDPDDRRVLYVVLALVLVVAGAAGIASFAGQTAMGPYTQLPPWLFFVIPLFIDLPIMVVSFLIPIFRARGESVVTSWIMLGTLTALSSAINVVHVLDGATMSVNTLTGCVVMGLAPIVIMISFEEVVRLAVHTPEKE